MRKKYFLGIMAGMFYMSATCGFVVAEDTETVVDVDVEGENGFYGSIILGGLYGSSNSNLFAEGKRGVLKANDTGGRSTDGGLLFLGELGYLTESGTNIYISLVEDFTLGVSQDFAGLGTATVEGLYATGTVWQNPYLKGIARSKSDTVEFGGRVALDGILDYGFGLEYALLSVDVDKDVIGSLHKELQRDGETHTFSANYMIPLGETQAIIPSVTYAVGDLDGTANSYKGWSTELGYSLSHEVFIFEAGAVVGKNDHDAIDPIYGQIREDKMFGVEGKFTWLEPFEFEDFFVILVSTYSKVDSNIKFYDSEEYLVGAGLGYSF